MLRQRVYTLATGYEDLNDHCTLRHDTVFQTTVETDTSLAIMATLHRSEYQADRHTMIHLHDALVQQFTDSFKTPPKKLILDFDATDNPIHGDQVGKYLNHYYDHHCFLPLYVFCGHQLLTAYLRPSSCGAAHHAGAALALLTKRLRQVWPRVNIVLRGDAGFCTPMILGGCDRYQVDYVIGMGQNSRLMDASQNVMGTGADNVLREMMKNYINEFPKQIETVNRKVATAFGIDG